MEARARGGKVKPRKAQLARAGGAPAPIAIDGARFSFALSCAHA
jgi:hypothetical protein